MRIHPALCIAPRLILLLAAGAALSAADLVVLGTTIPAGTTGVLATSYQGRARSVRIHVPSGFAAGAPVVVVLHGGSGTAASIEASSGWSTKADTVGCLVLYPQGLSLDASGVDDPANETSYWANDRGTRPDQFGVDDVGYITGLVQTVAAAGAADSDRVYAMGISNGGMMVHRLGRDSARTWAGLCSVSGSYTATPSVTPFAPAAPVSVLLIHGTSDTVVPYAGGAVLGQGGPVLGAVETRDLWCQRDRTAATGSSAALPDVAVDGCTSERVDFTGGDAGTRVALVTVTGGNHSWPGSTSPAPGAGAGSKTMDFRATDLAWDFFQPLRRQGEVEVSRAGQVMAAGSVDAPGPATVGAPLDLAYTVSNLGSATLSLGVPQLASASGCSAEVVLQPPTALSPGATAGFTVRVVPSAATWQVACSLSTNDTDEAVVSWTIASSASDGSSASAAAVAGSSAAGATDPAATAALAAAGAGGGGGGGCGLGGLALVLVTGLAWCGRRRGVAQTLS